MRDAWFIAWKDVTHLLKHRETIAWVFVMPIVFMYFVGTVTGGVGFPAADRFDSLAFRAPANGGVLMDEFVRRLEAQHFRLVRPEGGDAFTKAPRLLTISDPPPPYATFTDAAVHGVRQVLILETRDDMLSGQYDQVRVARAVYEVLADLAVVSSHHAPANRQAFMALRDMPRTLTLSVRPAGHRRDPPGGFSQAVPGEMVMFTMLVLLTVGAIILVVERERGLLRRLASTPITPGAIVFGKWMSRMMLGLVQIAFAALAGTVLFRMEWGSAWPMVGVILIAWAALTASLALVLGSLARSTAQMTGLGVLVTMVLAALGGCMWPIEIAPRWMQAFSMALPTGWTMDALHQLVNFGSAPTAALPHAAGLLAGALLLGWVGVRVFRYQ